MSLEKLWKRSRKLNFNRYSLDMLINDRFYIDPLRNEISDKQKGKLERVEPRLMKLLCLLVENEGRTVSRKKIVREIWDDYPGGDEGLNQAVSVLRKLLNDNEKLIIETLPKTGYSFHGTIEHSPIVAKRKSNKVIYALAALFLLLTIALAATYYKYRPNDKIIPGKLSHEAALRASKIDSKENSKGLTMDSLAKLDSKKGLHQ
ncbi:MAG TPA: winged helix-turn-helix domain-containing protein [Puia sp.]|nr:winged helix-turn-helix domain-containing protein [Puia sp.]